MVPSLLEKPLTDGEVATGESVICGEIRNPFELFENCGGLLRGGCCSQDRRMFVARSARQERHAPVRLAIGATGSSPRPAEMKIGTTRIADRSPAVVVLEGDDGLEFVGLLRHEG